MNQHPFLGTYLQALRDAEQNLLLLLVIVFVLLIIYCAAVYFKRQREISLALTAFFWLTFLMAIVRGV